MLLAAEKRDWKERLLAEIPIMIGADRARLDNLATELVMERSCPQPVRVTVTETVERDPTRVIALYADYDDAASDQLALALDANGFITSLSGTTTDRSGDTLVGAVKTLAAVTTLVNPADLARAPLTGPTKGVIVTGSRDACNLSGSAIARSERLRARLARTASIDESAIKCALALLEVPDDSPEIDIALPREITFLIPAPATTGVSTATTSIDFSAVPGLGLTGSIQCAIGRAQRTENAVGEGLVTSTPTPCEIVILRDDAELARANTWSLDSTRTTLLEVPRTPLVTQAAGYTFANGRQTGASWNRPSPTEQVVTLPVRMIGAFVEGVTAGASGARGQTEAETAQINAETARIQALAALAEARAKLEKPDAATGD